MSTALLAVLERIASALEAQVQSDEAHAQANQEEMEHSNQTSDRIVTQQAELVEVSKQAYANQITSYQASIEYYQLQIQAMRGHMADCPICARQMADAHPGHQA